MTQPCPTNQQVGKEVDTLTLKALLALPLTQLQSGEYRFCPDPTCPTVYYRADGQQVFSENELRERVYQKHRDDPSSVICYCFGHTLADVRAALARGQPGALLASIEAGIHAGQCACDIRNPQGVCCLGNVRTLIEPPLGRGPTTWVGDAGH